MGSLAPRPSRQETLRSSALAALGAIVVLLVAAPGAEAASCTHVFSSAGTSPTANSSADAQGFRWDITTGNLSDTWNLESAGGFINDGGWAHLNAGRFLLTPGPSDDQSEAYDGWGVLKVDNTSFGGAGTFDYYTPPGTNGCSLDADSGGRELVFPVMTFETLEVHRKVYVPDPSSGMGFVRFLDVVKNTGVSTATVEVSFEGDLGSDEATRVQSTSNGDSVIALPDRWATTDTDQSAPGYDPSHSVDPPVAHVWDGPGVTEAGLFAASDLNEGNPPVSGWTTARPLRVIYTPSIGAGQTVAFMHFDAQRSTPAGALTVAQGLGDATSPGGEGFAFMSDELGLLKNWDSNDIDGDSAASGSDNCPFVQNADQANADGDGTGNVCDSDDDNDGLSDATEAALGTNPLSADSDGDGKPDPSDSCPLTVGTGADGCALPPTAPPAATDKTPPRVTLTVPSKVKLKKFLKGLSVAARVNETASLKFELLGSPPPKKRAKTRAKAFTRVLARQSLATAGAGLRATRLRPSKKLVGKALKFAVRVRATAVDRAGNKTVVTRTIRVR